MTRCVSWQQPPQEAQQRLRSEHRDPKAKFGSASLVPSRRAPAVVGRFAAVAVSMVVLVLVFLSDSVHAQCSAGQFRGFTVPSQTAGQSWCTLWDSSVKNAPTDATVTSLTTCCGTCPVGTFNINGVGTCTSCPTGRYQNDTGASICRLCPAGKYNNVVGATACFDCPPGKPKDNENEDCVRATSSLSHILLPSTRSQLPAQPRPVFLHCVHVVRHQPP